jgi:hypothetical protein
MIGMGGRRTRRTAPALALIAAVLWLIGVELVPNVHLALHDSLAVHAHEGDTTVFSSHVHANGSEHRVVMRAGHRVHTRSARDLALQLEHGAHSLAHHAVALQPAPAPILVPLPIDRRPVEVVAIAIIEPSSRVVPRATARGPPCAAFATSLT